MNNSIQILRRLSSLRGWNRLITSKYCTEHKGSDKSELREDSSTSSSSKSPAPETRVNVELGDKKDVPITQGKPALDTFDNVKRVQELSTMHSESVVKDEPSVESYAASDEIVSEARAIPNKTRFTGEGRKQRKDKTSLENVSDETYHEWDTGFEDVRSSMSNTDRTLKSDKREKEGKGFLAAYEKQQKLLESKKAPAPTPEETFASLLRKSTFIDLGVPKGKVVIGTVYHVVDNDLYIDFGWKFHTVCTKPKKETQNYVVGAKVYLKIKDLELVGKFLGDEKYCSLNEADCALISYVPTASQKKVKEEKKVNDVSYIDKMQYMQDVDEFSA